jgi:hypothetical protein
MPTCKRLKPPQNAGEYLVFEAAEASLHEVLSDGRLETELKVLPATCDHFALCVLRASGYVSRNGWYHGDIKCSNWVREFTME